MDILITGYGRMGRMVEQVMAEQGDMRLIGAVDAHNRAELADLPPCDCVIDFSSPSLTPDVVAYVKRTGSPLVCGTTGLSAEGEAAVRGLGEYAPTVYSTNYSLGVAILARAVRQAAEILGEDFDCEIVETHHRKKLDSPSGTALSLARAVDPMGERRLVYGREGTGERERGDIGMHSLRGGTEAGEHRVIFLGEDEAVEFCHRASSRRIFAVGAVKAARALRGMPKGFYTVEQILFRD